MSGGIAAKVTGTLTLLLLVLVKAFPQAYSDPVRIMFYNVENLFDIYDDTLTDDDEFLPGGLRRWNYSRYRNKINSLYKCIVAAGEWEPPAVAAFCEIENRSVLEDLVYRTNLMKFSYRIIHEDSPDERGIDVALIYREDNVELIDYQYIDPFGPVSGFRTRNILYARFLAGFDTIHLLVSHWPSRRGGVLAGESGRMKVAGTLRSVADSLYTSHHDPKIILTGDFNAMPGDRIMDILTQQAEEFPGLVNLSAYLPDNYGTYRYRGIWEIIDQVLVSEALLENRRGYYTENGFLSVFRPAFLLRKDPQYPGLSPFSTYSGYRYQGGYSDHLPVIIDLRSW